MGCERKLENCDFFQEEEEKEEDEEALSFSDLPINLTKEDADEESRPLIKSEDDFDFRSWSRELEMCAADDLFFQGRILPLRHSIGSQVGPAKFNHENPNASHCVSIPETMDGFTSFSSRSSSTNSHYSSSSRSSNSTTAARNPRPSIRSQFHTHPSPKPQIRVSTFPTITNRNRKYPVWEFFRLGLVPTPGIELQHIKARSYVSRSSSSGSSSNNSICSINKRDKVRSTTGNGDQSTEMEKQRKQRDGERLLGGCGCSAGSAVKPVPRKIDVVKSKCDDNNHKVKESARKSKDSTEKEKMEKQKLMMEEQQVKKQNESRYHRTFEWLKELSVGSGHPADS